MEQRQVKAIFFILLLAGHEANRVSQQSSLVDGVPTSDVEKQWQDASKHCKFRLTKGGCTGDGCKFRSLPLDLPPPSSQSCRLSDTYMLHTKRKGHFIQLQADLLRAKAKKYREEQCKDRFFDLKCMRRLKHMLRALQFISQASKDMPEDLQSTARLSVNDALNEFSATLGRDGELGRRLAVKLSDAQPDLKDPRQLVRVLGLIISLLKGTEDEKNAARQAIEETEASPDATIHLPEDLERAVAAGELAAARDVEEDGDGELDSDGEGVSLQQVASKFDAAAQVKEELDGIDVDNLFEDLEADASPQTSGESSSSMLQVRSEGTLFNTLALIVYTGLVVAASFFVVIPIIAMMTYWGLFSLVGCSAGALATNAFQTIRYGRSDEVWNAQIRNITVKKMEGSRWQDMFQFVPNGAVSIIRNVRPLGLRSHFDIGDEIKAVQYYNFTPPRWITVTNKKRTALGKYLAIEELRLSDKEGRERLGFVVQKAPPLYWGTAGILSCAAKMVWLPVYLSLRAFGAIISVIDMVVSAPYKLFRHMRIGSPRAEVLHFSNWTREKKKRGRKQKSASLIQLEINDQEAETEVIDVID
eukprot:TRINITY_DN14723_c0_g1_i4.p1 TRINITY_DN14723_c0_g1~~TRINITY_DN14723_c0_g1_i4.p1  ORF type:complete len:587 (-),score=132.52 TRINITY_DN14723_c0_g1_i4:51-1811(-)